MLFENPSMLAVVDYPNGKTIGVLNLTKVKDSINTAKFIGDNEILLFKDSDTARKYIYRYNVSLKKITDTIILLDKSFAYNDAKFQFANNNKSLYVLRANAYIDKYNLVTGEFVKEIPNSTPADYIWKFSVSNDETTIALAFNDDVKIRNMNGDSILQINELARNTNDSLLLTANGETVIIKYSAWDINTNKVKTGFSKFFGVYKNIIFCKGYDGIDRQIDSETWDKIDININDSFECGEFYKQDNKYYTLITNITPPYNYIQPFNITDNILDSLFYYPPSIVGILNDNSIVISTTKFFGVADINFNEICKYNSNITGTYSCVMGNLLPITKQYVFALQKDNEDSSTVFTYDFITKQLQETGKLKDTIINTMLLTKDKKYLLYRDSKYNYYYYDWTTKEQIATFKSNFNKKQISLTGDYYYIDTIINASTVTKIVNINTKSELLLEYRCLQVLWTDDDQNVVTVRDPSSGRYLLTVINMLSGDSVRAFDSDATYGNIIYNRIKLLNGRYLWITYEDWHYSLYDLKDFSLISDFDYPEAIEIYDISKDLQYIAGFSENCITIWRTNISDVSVGSMQRKQFSLSPVPAQTEVQLEFSDNSTGKIKLELVNSMGGKVDQFYFFKNAYTFSEKIMLNNKTPGVYFINIYINNIYIDSKKLVIID